MLWVSDSEYSQSLSDVKGQRYIIKSSIATEVILNKMSSVLLELDDSKTFLSEYTMQQWFQRKGLSKVYVSFPRSPDGAFELWAWVYSADQYSLVSATLNWQVAFPKTQLYGLNLQTHNQENFGHPFYFAYGGFRVCYRNLKNKELTDSDFKFFTEAYSTNLYYYTPMPGSVYFRYPNQENQEELYKTSVQGDAIKILDNNNISTQVSEYRNAMVKKYWLTRTDWDIMFINMMTDYPFNYHPRKLSEEQEAVKKDLGDKLDRIRNPTDRFQYLNKEFQFGIAHFQFSQEKQKVEEGDQQNKRARAE